jgi:trimethylamine--corrinoid protein Co-methyltransferase
MSNFANRFRIRTPYSILSEEGKKRIHEAALDVMQKTGIRIHSETARASLKKEGAIIAPNGTDVKFPPGLVEELISRAPSKIVLAGRNPEYDLPLDGTHSYYTTDGCGIQVWDSVNGVRRKSLLEDIRKTAVISDYLPYVSIYEPMVVAQDVPEKTHVIQGVKVAMENTSKHILTESTTKPGEARAQVKMASEVVGGAEELRKRHYISAMVCTMSPLVLEGPCTEAAMVWAENHVPVHITGMAQTGISGPATIAGDLTVNHAETLALACAMQAHEPGSPCLYGSVLSSLDPVTGSYMGGSPESTILCAAAVEMGRYCKMPISTGGLGSGAKVPGTRASMENALSAAMCAVAGGEVVNGLGVIDGSTLLSYEQLLFDNEIAGMTVRIFAGFDVTEDTLAVDLIKKVGIGGTYLSQRHTMTHIRDFYKPLAWGSYVTDELTFNGRGDHVEQARGKISKILKDHTPESLDSDVRKRLDGIVEEFGKA